MSKAKPYERFFLYIILKEFLRIYKVGFPLAFGECCDIMAHYKGYVFGKDESDEKRNIQ